MSPSRTAPYYMLYMPVVGLFYPPGCRKWIGSVPPCTWKSVEKCCIVSCDNSGAHLCFGSPQDVLGADPCAISPLEIQVDLICRSESTSQFI